MEKILTAAIQELADESLYEHEAELFHQKIIDGEHIGKTFKRFAEEEAVHSKVFSEIVATVTGSTPSLPEPKRVPRSDSLRASLQAHIEMELQSIRLYEEILKLPLPPKEALLIKGILADEQEHLKTVIHYLKRFKGK